MDTRVETCDGYGKCMSQTCAASDCVLKRDTGRGYRPSRDEAAEISALAQATRARGERDIAAVAAGHVTATEIVERNSAVAAELAKRAPTILEEAGLLVNEGGDRNDAYDHPYHNFSKIAAVATIVFGIDVNPRQVGLFMIGMKLVRDSHKARRDNIVDIAGYARCIERLEEWENRPEGQKQ